MFDAVIFDWDGTLADTHRSVVEAFQKALKAVGAEVTYSFIQRRIGIGARETIKEALGVTNMIHDEKTIDWLLAEKTKHQLEVAKEVNLFEGAFDLLKSLHDQIEIALASMNNRVVIDKLLSIKGVGEFFDVVIAADEICEPKPDPEIFLACATRMKCHPEHCVVVEDSIFGVRAAKRAKMKCIAISTGAYSREELLREKPDLTVESMNEKMKLLGFILR